LLPLAAVPGLAFARVLLPPDASVSVGRAIDFAGFVDESGETFTARRQAMEAAPPARPWIVSPMYARCPHTCSPITQELVRALRESGLAASEYRVLSFSFDPEETEEAVRTFRERHALPPDWPALRATSPGALGRVLAALDFRTIRTGEAQFDHPNLVAVLTPDLRVSDYLLGVRFSPDALARSVRAARSGRLRSSTKGTLLTVGSALGLATSALAFMAVWERRRRRLRDGAAP
jgi:cytochrome oxidase Cu insertion factor (SCO1/SenC/PrrC family)